MESQRRVFETAGPNGRRTRKADRGAAKADQSRPTRERFQNIVGILDEFANDLQLA